MDGEPSELFRYLKIRLSPQPYLDFCVPQIDEEAYEAAKMVRKQRKMKQKSTAVEAEGAFFNTDLQGDELSGQGLKMKMVGDEVELCWSTAGEVCLGYKVQKRLARTSSWTTVSSYEKYHRAIGLSHY